MAESRPLVVSEKVLQLGYAGGHDDNLITKRTHVISVVIQIIPICAHLTERPLNVAMCPITTPQSRRSLRPDDNLHYRKVRFNIGASYLLLKQVRVSCMAIFTWPVGFVVASSTYRFYSFCDYLQFDTDSILAGNNWITWKTYDNEF